MMVDIADVIASARFSWQCNYSIATPRWRLTQLHCLYRLLLDSRDDLMTLLSKSHDKTQEAYERELALVIHELNSHISYLTSLKFSQKLVKLHRGESKVSYLPTGVNLIVSEPGNRFRSLLLPLAASIAAGNVTIIATIAGSDEEFVDLLSRLWNKYLDQDCNFFVPNLRLSELDPRTVDLVSIFGLLPEPYSSVLSSNKARFYSTAPGHNLALVTEGKKQWKKIAADIARSYDNAQMLWEDRLHAIFVRDEDYTELSRHLVQYEINTTTMDTTKQEQAAIDFAIALEVSKKAGSLIIISMNSIGRALDVMIAASSPIQQLALLGPEAHNIANFVEPWLDIKVLSVGSISSVPILGSGIGSVSFSSNVLVSPTIFSRKMLKTTAKDVVPPKTTSEIRATYQNLIVPLRPEHDGKRIGFFTQVEYLVKGVGIAAGLLGAVGSLYLTKWALQRAR